MVGELNRRDGSEGSTFEAPTPDQWLDTLAIDGGSLLDDRTVDEVWLWLESDPKNAARWISARPEAWRLSFLDRVSGRSPFSMECAKEIVLALATELDSMPEWLLLKSLPGLPDEMAEAAWKLIGNAQLAPADFCHSLSTIAARDPARLVRWLSDCRPPDLTAVGIDDVFLQAAKADARVLFEALTARDLPWRSPELESRALRAWAQVAFSDEPERLEKSREWSALGDRQRVAVLAGIADRDAEAAWRISESLPVGARIELALDCPALEDRTSQLLAYESAWRAMNGEILNRAIEWLAKADPAEALTRIGSVADAESSGQAIASCMQAIANADPVYASEWLASLPPDVPFRDGAVAAFVPQIPDDPASALRWTLTISEPALREQILRGVLGETGYGTELDYVKRLGLSADEISAVAVGLQAGQKEKNHGRR